MDKFGLREKKTDTVHLWGFRHSTGTRGQSVQMRRGIEEV